MNTSNEISRFYSKLFTLGSLKRNLFAYILLMLVPTYLGLTYNAIFLYLAIILVLITIVEYASFRSILIRSYRLFNMRRILAANWMVSALSFPPLIAIILNVHLIYILALMLMIYITWKTIIYSVLTFEGYKHSFIIISLNLIFILIFSIIAKTPIIIPLLLICILTSFTYIYLLDKVTRVGKYGGITYFRSYIASWAADEPRYMEYLLSKESVQRSTSIYLFNFKSEDDEFKLVIPYFHFGPFKDVGSSAFPGRLINEAALRKIGLAVLHAAVTHDLDLATSDDVNRVINIIFVDNGFKKLSGISRLISMDLDDASVSGFKLGDIPLLVLSYKETEDLPPQIHDKLKHIAKKYGFDDVIVIDAHNSLTKPHIKMTEEVINCLCEVSDKVLGRLATEPLYKIILSYQVFKLEGFSLADGLGSGGIAIVLWKTDDEYNVIIIFDSNNMNPNYRNELVNRVKEVLKKANVIVVTTDTHEVTARTLIKDGYVIWGSRKKHFSSLPQITNKILNLQGKLKEYIISYKKINVNLNILGENIVDKAEELIRRSLYYAKLLSSIPISSIALGILLLVYLIAI